MILNESEWKEINNHIHTMKDLITVCEMGVERKSFTEIGEAMRFLKENMNKITSLNNTNGDFSLASPSKIIFNVQNLHFGTNPGGG